MKGIFTMLANELEKGAMYLINNFGVLMHVYGSEAGYFDEAGSVYVTDIISKI